MLSNYRERILKAKDARAVPMCIVGTQSTSREPRLLRTRRALTLLSSVDQEEQREVLTSDGKKLAFDWKSSFTEASSETGENVEAAFLLSTSCALRSGACGANSPLTLTPTPTPTRMQW
jgi:hypothetical protein